jgi:hypothetical protein
LDFWSKTEKFRFLNFSLFFARLTASHSSTDSVS